MKTIFTILVNWGFGWQIEYQSSDKEKILDEIDFLLKSCKKENIELRKEITCSWEDIDSELSLRTK